MSLSVQLGLLLALATAFSSVLGFLYKHRGAVESPTVEWDGRCAARWRCSDRAGTRSGSSSRAGSWALHVGALSLAPISLVQSVIAGGLVLLTVTADRLFAHQVTRREWIGVALAALGLAFLAATLEGAGRSAHSSFEAARLVPWVAGLATLALVVAATSGTSRRRGVVLGASAGLFWAASDSSIKALSGHLGDGAASVLLSPLAAVIALASFAGLVVSAKSLQIGKAVPVIAVTSVAANVFTIAAGPIVFGEPLPDTSLGLLMRLLAFALVISAAALTPAPTRAAHLEPS